MEWNTDKNKNWTNRIDIHGQKAFHDPLYPITKGALYLLLFFAQMRYRGQCPETSVMTRPPEWPPEENVRLFHFKVGIKLSFLPVPVLQWRLLLDLE